MSVDDASSADQSLNGSLSTNANTNRAKKTTSRATSHESTSSSLSSLSVRDQNQEFLLSIPSFLFRLVNLVRRKDYTIRFSGANSEIENWIRYLKNISFSI